MGYVIIFICWLTADYYVRKQHEKELLEQYQAGKRAAYREMQEASRNEL